MRFDVKGSGELNVGEVMIVGEVIDVAFDLFFGCPVFSFEREKDVASGPVPMEAVEIGVEWMIGRVLRGISVVRFFWNSYRKANGLVRARGDIGEGK